MKPKLIILSLTLALCASMVMAQEKGKNDHRLSQEEFKVKFQQFITVQAGLTEKEATAFFPIYDECQKKKHELNSQIWSLRKEARKKQLTEAEFKKLMEKIAELNIEINKLDKEYLPLYNKAIPYKKIFEVQGAEARFHRELLKEMRHPKKEK